MADDDPILTSKSWWDLVDREHATAKAMVENREHCAAAWNATGRAVEFALKGLIMARENLSAWPDRKQRPDLHTHDIRTLMSAAGIELKNCPPPPRQMLRTVMDWSREHDYRHGVMPRKVARDMVNSAFGSEGVVQWLKNQ